MSSFLFQYCQKIVVFDKEDSRVLLCKRKGEADFDGTYSFIGGKMEVSDESILAGLKREKDEEIGDDIKIDVLFDYPTTTFFKKKDGNSMILPHYYAKYIEGTINLNDEYHDYKRVLIDELDAFEPKIHTIPIMVKSLLHLKEHIGNKVKYIRI